MTELGASFIRECFDYDAESGSVTWKVRPRSHFSNEAAFQTHNRHRAGLVAGGIDRSTGYRVVGLCRALYYAHRLAWMLHYGEWPSCVTDHIDGNKLNNSIANLRAVTQLENGKNASLRKSNTSGVTGVNFDSRSGKWRARVMSNYREVYSALFINKDDAIAARAIKARELGFSETHGRIGARHGVWGED